MESLFRKEAMQARTDLWLGSVQLRPAVPYNYLAFFCLLMLIGLLTLLFEGTFSRKIHLDGELAQQTSSVVASTAEKSPMLVAHFVAPLQYIRSLTQGESVTLAYDGLSSREIGIPAGQIYAVKPLTDNRRRSGGRYCDVFVVLPSQSISIDGRLIVLMAGMHVTGSIVVERRSLLSWLTNAKVPE